MAGVNKVILVGNLGKEPELKYLDGNIAKLSFSLATKEIYKDKSGQRAEHTEWHNIVMWRNVAENEEKNIITCSNAACRNACVHFILREETGYRQCAEWD